MSTFASSGRATIKKRSEAEENASLWGIGHMMIGILSLSIVAVFLNTLFEEMVSGKQTKLLFWVFLYLPLAIIWGYVVPMFIRDKGRKWVIPFLSINLVVITGTFLFIGHSEPGLQYFSKSTGKLMSSYVINVPWEKAEDRYNIVPFLYNDLKVQLHYTIPSESPGKRVVDQSTTISGTPLTFGAYKKLQEIQTKNLSISVDGNNLEDVRKKICETFLGEIKIPAEEIKVEIWGVRKDYQISLE